jgi:hypothetical protein
MKLTIKLVKEEVRCYKSDEPCVSCPDLEIMKLQLTLNDVKGHVVTVSGGGYEKTGFMCDKCISAAREGDEHDITVE